MQRNGHDRQRPHRGQSSHERPFGTKCSNHVACGFSAEHCSANPSPSAGFVTCVRRCQISQSVRHLPSPPTYLPSTYLPLPFLHWDPQRNRSTTPRPALARRRRHPNQRRPQEKWRQLQISRCRCRRRHAGPPSVSSLTTAWECAPVYENCGAPCLITTFRRLA